MNYILAVVIRTQYPYCTSSIGKPLASRSWDSEIQNVTMKYTEALTALHCAESLGGELLLLCYQHKGNPVAVCVFPLSLFFCLLYSVVNKCNRASCCFHVYTVFLQVALSPLECPPAHSLKRTPTSKFLILIITR